MGRFDKEIESLIEEGLCAAAQIGQDFARWQGRTRSRILGIDPTENQSGVESFEPAKKWFCGNAGTLPNEVSVDYPAQPLPGNCAVRYYLRARLTYSPGIGQPVQTDILGVNSGNTYTGPLGDISIEPAGDSSIIRWSDTNGFLVGPGYTLSPPPVLESIPVRVDGGDDNCGSDGQPLDGPVPAGPVISGPLVYDGPDGNPVSEPVTITGKDPVRNPDGTTTYPFEVCFQDVCIDVEYDPGSGLSGPIVGGQPGASLCCPPFDVDGLEDSPEDAPEPESDERFAGVLTTCTIDPSLVNATEIGNGVGPSLYIPRLGVVRFACQLGSTRAWTVDQDIKQVRQFTQVNAPALAYAWDIIANQGVDISATGVRADV